MACRAFVAVAAMMACATATEQKVTPVQKVVQMMQDMVAKGTQEKQDEEVRMTAFNQWCDNTNKHKSAAIKRGNSKIEKLNAAIGKATSDIRTLTEEISGLDGDMDTWAGDKKAATEVRDMEKKDYDATHADYSESLDALTRAIDMLKRKSADKKQAEAMLLQVASSKMVPSEAKASISAFLQADGSDNTFLAVPEANAYEFQSGGIVEMMEGLKDKFWAERDSLEKEERNSAHAYDMMQQDLTDSIEGASAQRADKLQLKSKTEKAKAQAEGDLEETTATRDEDQKYLDDTNKECAQKNSSYEKRQQLRAEELEAIKKAIEIISSGSVAGAAEKHLPSLAQQSAAFVQISSHSPAQQKLASFLQAQANKLNSKVLAMLATQVQAASTTSEDPFKQVKKMIKNMVVKLMEQANQEAEQKGWCDTELTTNKQTRDSKSSEVESLTAQAEELTALSAQLAQEIAETQEQVAELEKERAEATELRNKEHAKNTQTVKEAKEAQSAVENALSILKEFYAKASEATDLIQKPAEDAPATFDDDEHYKGLGGESGGVVGMLEVILSDFSRLEAETVASEEQASDNYKTFMNDSEVDLAMKGKDIEHKSAQRQKTEDDLAKTKKELGTTQEELDAAMAYYEKLKAPCVSGGVSYEERVARRKEEIQSLQEALSILSGEEFA